MADATITPAPVVSAVKPVKTGIKTTEFALTIFVNIITVGMTFSGMIPASWMALILAIVNSIYGIGRAIVKNGDPAYQVPALPAGVAQ
jgi:hypothetical protein